MPACVFQKPSPSKSITSKAPASLLRVEQGKGAKDRYGPPVTGYTAVAPAKIAATACPADPALSGPARKRSHKTGKVSRNPQLNLRRTYKLHAELGCPFREQVDPLLTVLLFVKLAALVHVHLALLEGPVNDTR